MGSMATEEVGSWVEGPHPTPQVAEEHNLAHSGALGEQKQVAALVVLDTRRHGGSPTPFLPGSVVQYLTQPPRACPYLPCASKSSLSSVLCLALPYCGPPA